MFSRLSLILISLAGCALAQPGQPAPAQPSAMRDSSGQTAPLPAALQGVGVKQRLDTQVPLQLAFRDEFNRAVPLSTYFHGKPVILAFVYYRCPMLCTAILTGLESSLKAVSFNPGRDF